jgi:N-acetylneuraminate synthase
METFIIAEIGINHNGRLENALRLIDAAAAAGCQAAKFQTFTAKRLYPRSAGRLDWTAADGSHYDYDIYQAVEGFELPPAWVPELIAHCLWRKIEFLSSVFDARGLDFLVAHGMQRIKLSSYTITHRPLIEACAATGLPIVMSTGGATLAETEAAVETVLRRHDRLALLHCSIQYPTALEDCHLGVIETLQKAFPEVAVGYSDHTREVAEAPVQAVYLGARVLEKHVTLDKSMSGPDHFFAIEPDELQQMVARVREAEKGRRRGSVEINPVLYGSSAKRCRGHEQYLRDFAYVTLFTTRAMAQGEEITPEDISILRPGKKGRGLDPRYIELFHRYKIFARRPLAAEDPVTWDVLLGNQGDVG